MKIFTTLALAITLLLVGCGEAPKSSNDNSTKAATPKVEAHLDPSKLIGRWMRSDGNYTIKVDKVKEQGYLAASYFNPSPIHTDKTTFKVENNQLKLHMLLNDKQYPKCTYDLIYNHEKQALVGQYFQATSGQTYNVIFQKI